MKNMTLIRFQAILLTVALLSVNSLAQPLETTRRTTRSRPVVYSTASEWQKVTLRPTSLLRPTADGPASSATQPASAPTRPVATEDPAVAAPRYTPPPTSSYRPAFTGDFATNRNGWKAGNRGDYNYQIGLGKYNIRKRNGNTRKAAFSYVSLPPDINLNVADQFTIKIDVVADSGRIPTGGLLFGVRDSLNYCAFMLSSKGEVSIIRMANGKPTDDMPGDYFKPGILLARNRNRLIIQRKNDALHFYVNDEEVRSSPYSFRMLPGNGIGMTTTAYWTSFQKLTVTLGP